MNLDAIYKEHYSDMPREEFDRRVMGKHGKVDHESLEGLGVVTASTSHELQRVAPDIKPVVKGTKAEVLNMKKAGQVAPGNIVFTLPDDVAYIIDPEAVQAIYGGSKGEAVKLAKLDLKAGGDTESTLLGYPKREGVENPTTVAVDRGGDVVTDLAEMKEKAEAGDVIWAAEGKQQEVQDMAATIGKRWKTIGEENNAEDDQNA